MSVVFRPPGAGDLAAMLALNNRHSAETSVLSLPALQSLIASSFFTKIAGAVDAFCVALDQDARYDNPNFDWFHQRFRRFVYIDRVIVADDARGRGLARAMYEDLASVARGAGHDMLCCEVNIEPQNLRSERFHEVFGFSEVGRAVLISRQKTVRYLSVRI